MFVPFVFFGISVSALPTSVSGLSVRWSINICGLKCLPVGWPNCGIAGYGIH